VCGDHDGHDRARRPPGDLALLLLRHVAVVLQLAAVPGDEESERVVFHTDRGATYTAHAFTTLCRRLGIRQSMGRVGSCFDDAAAEAFFSSLEWEVLSRNRFSDTIQAQAVVIDWCYTFYNHQRRHSAADGLSPVNYEIREAKTKPEAA
jgi:putative transposase